MARSSCTAVTSCHAVHPRSQWHPSRSSATLWQDSLHRASLAYARSTAPRMTLIATLVARLINIQLEEIKIPIEI